MKTFFNTQDIGYLNTALAEAQEVKRDRFKFQQLGKNKTLLMIFSNNSLRTRLSTQKADVNLGMTAIVLDVIKSNNSLVIPQVANREISAQVVIKRMLESL